jgi:hypothetical protein
MTEDQVTITQDELEEKYADLLDELYPEYILEHLTFRPSQILKKCDPVAWRAHLADYADSLARTEGVLIPGYTD